DLRLTAGSVAQAPDGLTGSVTVYNASRRRAPRTKLGLTAGATLLARINVPRLGGRASIKITVDLSAPANLAPGSYKLRMCADERRALRERSETNNCRRVGRLIVTQGYTPTPTGSSVPTDPVAFQKDTVFTLDSPETKYWIYVPSRYDDSHQTPIPLFVWLHGCGGQSEYDISTVSPGGAQSYIAIAVGGREGGCWDPNTDTTKVLAAIANVETHFNVDPHRVIIGGYSSGGDLAYRTAFYNSNLFAGLLAENTSPFRDTGSSQADSIAAATVKFNIVHLAHTEDDTYGIDGVRKETDALKTAGFPITRIERPGGHYDADTATTGTDHDLRTLLLPHIDDGWTSP
ncbi:MAG: hypothetical protein QOF76_1904, partial [Solirubrobacteraceae bacterium]|nr:hypothetical protein [Solirubrobacteraceae bacterium]